MNEHWFDELLKTDFSCFIGKALQTVDPGATYVPNWHIDAIAEHLEAARRGDIRRLIINMPPRALKSMCVSVAWPAWILGHAPTEKIIAASYAASLSIKHSLDCRVLIGAPWYRRIFPQVLLAKDQNQKHKFMTTQRGFRFATSVGGSVLGEGGNFLVVDDPISPLQVGRKRSREQVNEWFDTTFSTRLNDKNTGTIVLVMQRLHAQDLSGHLMHKNGWTQLVLPSVSYRERIVDFGRFRKVWQEGEPLQCLREDIALLEGIKADMGSAAFEAQYQQNPLPVDGGMVKPGWFGRYQQAPKQFDRCVQSWDTAIKAGAENDASVCITFAQSEGRSFVVDVRVMRREYPDLKKAVYALAAQWQPHSILMEDKASGQQLLQDIRRESHLPMIGVLPRSDKVTRFSAVSAMIEAGRVVLPEQASWLAALENELYTFPSADHDDQVDALSQYLDWLRNAEWNRISVRRI